MIEFSGRLLLSVVIAFSHCFVGVAAAGDYHRDDLLIEAEDLRAWLAAPRNEVYGRDVVLVDVRPEAAHAAANLAPGRRIDIRQWTSAFGAGDDTKAWSRRIGAIVGDPSATVVVYDDVVTPNVARAWWILTYWGVDDVRILNGGIKAWRVSGGEVYAVSAALPDAGRFFAQPHPERLATRAEVLGLVAGDRPSACLVDTRSAAEVTQGIIPSATHADWVRFIDPATGKMRPADELAVLLGEAGFDADQPAVAYCRSGGRASVVAFAMELMGGRRVANYFGSWNDWRSDPASPVGRLSAPALPAETNR